MKTERQCSKCKKVKSLEEEFYNSKNGPDGKSVKCKLCHRVQSNTWRIEHPKRAQETYRRYGRNHRDIRRKYSKGYDIKHPLAARARDKVRNARKKGTLIKPERCEECNQKRKLVAHHEDYTKPLEVDWVCYPCHSIVEEIKRKKCA